MYCTTCGNYMMDEHRFCIYCGAARPVMPRGKRGTRWVPILIMALMFLLGFIVYGVFQLGW